MIYARLQYSAALAQTTIAEIITLSAEQPITDFYHQDIAKQFIDITDCTPEPSVNWLAELIDNKWSFTPPKLLPDPEPNSLQPDQQQLLAKIEELEKRVAVLESKV